MIDKNVSIFMTKRLAKEALSERIIILNFTPKNDLQHGMLLK